MGDILAVNKNEAMKVFSNMDNTDAITDLINPTKLTMQMTYKDNKYDFSAMDYETIFNGQFVSGDRKLLDAVDENGDPVIPDTLQIIPYIVLINEEFEVLVYKRSGSENRLLDKYSIGFGGHVDIPTFDDSNYTRSLLSNINSFLVSEARREIQEEVGYTGLFGINLGNVVERNTYPFTTQYRLIKLPVPYFSGSVPISTGFIYNDSDSVNKVHLGLVQIHYVSKNEIRIQDNEECNNIEWMSLGYVMDNLANKTGKLEAWSQVIYYYLHYNEKLIEDTIDHYVKMENNDSLISYIHDTQYTKKNDTKNKLIEIELDTDNIKIQSYIQVKNEETGEILCDDYTRYFPTVLNDLGAINDWVKHIIACDHHTGTIRKNFISLSTVDDNQLNELIDIRVYRKTNKKYSLDVTLTTHDIFFGHSSRYNNLMLVVDRLHRYPFKETQYRTEDTSHYFEHVYSEYFFPSVEPWYNDKNYFSVLLNDILVPIKNYKKYYTANPESSVGYSYIVSSVVSIDIKSDIEDKPLFVHTDTGNGNEIPGCGDIVITIPVNSDLSKTKYIYNTFKFTPITNKIRYQYMKTNTQAYREVSLAVAKSIRTVATNYFKHTLDKECVFALDHPDICTIFLSVKPYMLEHDISVFYKVVSNIITYYYGSNIGNMRSQSSPRKNIIKNIEKREMRL